MMTARQVMRMPWCIILLLAGLVIAGSAQAMPVKVGIYLQPPLVILDKSGKNPQGLAIDIVTATALKNDWNVTYIIDARTNLMNRLWRKDIDLLVPAPLPMERSGLADFSATIPLSSFGRLYGRAPLAIPSVTELNGKIIAVMASDIHYDRLQELLKQSSIQCQFIEMKSYDDVITVIKNQAADAGLLDNFYGESAREADGLIPLPIVSGSVDFHFAVPRDSNQRLIAALDRNAADFGSNQKSLYQKSLEDWTRRPHPAAPLIHWGLLLLGIVGGGIITAVVMLRIRNVSQHEAMRLISANRQLLKSVDDYLCREMEANTLRDWYQTLLNNTPDPVLVHDVDAAGKAKKFVEVNDAACSILGYGREELLALSPREIEVNANTSIPRYAKMLSRWRNSRLPDATPEDREPGSLSTELTLRTKNGAEIPMEMTSRILDHNGQPVVFCSLHDITAHRKVQQALKESERRFSDFFARSPIGVVLFNPNRDITDVNQAALGMFGMSERSHFSSVHLLTEGNISPEAQTTLLKGGTIRFETIIDFDNAVKEKQFHSTRTGKCYFDMLVTNLGLDANFNPKGYMLQMQDVTERRRAEDSLHQHERMLRQAQKMEAIGTLAGGIAHDFNNLLTPIIGYTEMAMMSLKPVDDGLRSNLSEVLNASNRAKDLVRQILTFSRQTEQEAKPIRLIPLVKEVVQLLRGTVANTAELKITIQTERDMVKADPIQIHQVIMNLCTNALHAMKGSGGMLEIGLNHLTVDSRARGTLARLRYGAYVELFVRDTGHGMDRAVLDRIFEPFFTTKASGEGTGMGLAVVHGIISTLQGAITVESEIGKGTIFHVYLPLIDQAPEQVIKELTPLPRGTERILLVDDEAGIVTMINQMLTSLGYQVMTCMRPSDAMEVFREDPSRFDIIISDQIMPGMTGIEMVHGMRHLRHDIPVILCTGFSKSIPEQDLRTEGINEVLMKPIVLRQLAEAIRCALKQRGQSPKP